MGIYDEKPWLKSYDVWATSLKPYPKIPVFKFLDDSARNFPNGTACVYLGKEWNYVELKEFTDRFANALAGLGIKKGDRVATILPNSPQFVIADYGIMKCGAANVPCSFLHKAPDLEYIFNTAGVENLICIDTALETINQIKEKTKLKNIIVTELKEFSAEESEFKEPPRTLSMRRLINEHEPKPPEVEINPTEDLCRVPFTGGATGTPKGVMQTHHAIATNVIQVFPWQFAATLDSMRGHASIILALPFFHIYGHWAMNTCIHMAFNMLMVPDPRDYKLIADFMRKYNPFQIIGVPTQFMKLLKEDIGDTEVLGTSGAAALPPEVQKEYEKKSKSTIVEGYGLTETSPVTHVNQTYVMKFIGLEPPALKTGSIGIPVPDTEVKVVDPNTGEEVPIGETGEMYIRGPQLMKGYWPTPGKGLTDGWLPTGDIVRMDEDGYFYVVDRVKDMINVSGYKVYSRIVDDILFEHPAVELASAIGIPDPERPGSERIKAFIKLKAGQEGKVNAQDIIEYCRGKLPPYAVPKFIEFRDDLPLTVTEKIFKRKLREEEIRKMKNESRRINLGGGKCTKLLELND